MRISKTLNILYTIYMTAFIAFFISINHIDIKEFNVIKLLTNPYSLSKSGINKFGNYKIPDTFFPSQFISVKNPNKWKYSKLVIIDPGHGGCDSGAICGGFKEKNICLDISLRLRSILSESGIKVELTRENDTGLEVIKRIQLANDKNAALFISLHSNWYNNPIPLGINTLYYPSKPVSSSLTDKTFAEIIQNELSSLGLVNRGIVPRTDLKVLKYGKMPSIIIELGFLSNPGDISELNKVTFRQQAAVSISNGIVRSLQSLE